MHQIERIDCENNCFSHFKGDNPPQAPPILTGAEVLSVLNLGASSIKDPGSAPAQGMEFNTQN